MESLKKKKINALMTAIIIFVSVLCVGIVYAPRIFGYLPYEIETGSMAPTIPEGSLIFVQKIDAFEKYNVNDIVTFTSFDNEESFTHRIVGINEEEKSFITKGDANKDNDVSPTGSEFAVGKVQFSIPYLGYVSKLLKKKSVKIAVALIYIAWAAIEIEVFRAERKKRDE